MKLIHKVRRTVEEVHALKCDKCAAVILAENVMEFQEALSIRISGGYASILGDGNLFELDLCQACVKELLGPYLRQVSAFSAPPSHED